MRLESLASDFGTIIRPEPGESTSIRSLDGGFLMELLSRREGGVVLLRGYDFDEEAFFETTERLGTRFLAHHNVGGREYVNGNPTFATVASSQKPIDFHIEMASNPIKPEVLWFLCVQPALWRGRVGFVDGATVLKCLTDRTRDNLEARGLLYEFREIPAEIWRASLDTLLPRCVATPTAARLARRWQKVAEVSDFAVDAGGKASFDHRINAIFISEFSGLKVLASGLLDNPKHSRFGDGEFVDRATWIEVAQATYQNAVWVNWERGDFALVDNLRVMHSREAFQDPQRRVLIRYSNRRRAAGREVAVRQPPPSVAAALAGVGISGAGVS